MKVRLFLVQTTVFTFVEKTTKSTTPHLICSHSERKIGLIIWGCICYDGVGTLTAVEGNINSAMYIDILFAFLETTSKLITFSQQSIKLLVGVLFDFFALAKLTEIQKHVISLLPHRIEACHSA